MVSPTIFFNLPSLSVPQGAALTKYLVRPTGPTERRIYKRHKLPPLRRERRTSQLAYSRRKTRRWASKQARVSEKAMRRRRADLALKAREEARGSRRLPRNSGHLNGVPAQSRLAPWFLQLLSRGFWSSLGTLFVSD